MRFSIIFFIVFSFGLNSSAQNFFRTYGNNNDEVGRSVIEALDTTYMIFGTSSSFVDGTSNFYLMNVDSLGNFNWSKTYGGNNVEQGHDICIKPNRNFLLTGYSNSFGNGYDIYAVEVDSVGNELWSKTYGGNDWDFAYSNISFPNGDVLITGNTYSFGNGGSDGFMLMVDDNGDSLWWNNYGTSTENILRKTILTSFGELLSIGSTVNSNGDKDFYLVKTNITGDTIWTKTYGSSLDDEGYSLLQRPNGNYILAGYTKGFSAVGADGYYFEIDTSGTVIWSQVNPGPGNGEEIFNSICMKPNEYRFYATWETTTYGNGGYEFAINSLYTNGGWNDATNTYGTAMNEKGYDIIFTSHKRVMAVGYTDSPFGNQNVMAVMSDTLFPTQLTSTNYEDVTSVSETGFNGSLKLFPNPANDFLNIDSDLSIKEVSIFDLTGKLIGNFKSDYKKIDVSNYPAGLYIIKINFLSGQSKTEKISITRQ